MYAIIMAGLVSGTSLLFTLEIRSPRHAAMGRAVRNAAHAAPTKEDKEAEAASVAGMFLKALKKADATAAVKASDLPFLWDGEEKITESKELVKRLEALFAEKDFTRLEFKITEIKAFSAVRDQLKPKQRELWKGFMEESDKVVFFKANRDSIGVFVRFKDGKAVVCGFQD